MITTIIASLYFWTLLVRTRLRELTSLVAEGAATVQQAYYFSDMEDDHETKDQIENVDFPKLQRHNLLVGISTTVTAWSLVVNAISLFALTYAAMTGYVISHVVYMTTILAVAGINAGTILIHTNVHKWKDSISTIIDKYALQQ